MTEEKYQELLKQAPADHFSDEFVQFLRDNNEVVEENEHWLIIKNCKDPNDYTAFHVQKDFRISWHDFLQNLIYLRNYKDREWKIKAPHKRSVGLYHVHLINKQ